MRRVSALALLVLLVVISPYSCATQTSGEAGTDIGVRVVATGDFGAELLLDEAVRVSPGTSAMQALKQVADVETRYGGRFVNGINGLRSQFPAKDDWFIYINGISINKGAPDYSLRDGDIVHFDLHDWHFRMFIPAIIGDFPGSLLHGYEGKVRPTVIVYDDGLEQSARDLETSFRELGLTEVSTRSAGELAESDKQRSNLMLIGTMDSVLMSELNRAWDRLGFFVHFGDSTMTVFDSKGELTAEYGAGSGVIQATQSPWNPKGIGVCENVVWMISGTDRAGARSAVDALINQYDKFLYAFAAVIDGGDVVTVPQ
ncbi:MAG: DUF4430 domain-containing protein [Dehalococcoidia bacterium]